MTSSPKPDMPNLRPVTDQYRFATITTIAALMLREMSSTYGRNPGGYLWVILEPVLGIMLLTAAFSLVMRSPPLGSSFAIFYATGLVPFFVFNGVTSAVGNALGYSKQLLSYPRVTFVDALLARLILNTLTQFMSGFIILTVLMTVQDEQTSLDMFKISLAMLMAVVLGGGIGTLNCYLITRFPIWRSVWSVITRPLLLFSGVLLLPESIPEPFQGYLWYNPIAHVVSKMRTGFYPYYGGEWISPAYVFGVGLTCGLVGLMFLRRYYRDVLEL